MAKKQRNKQSSEKPKVAVGRVSDRMPEWMREYLSGKGIEGEFNVSKLSKEQCIAIDLAETLYHQETQGHIRVTYDPKKDSEPQAEPTQQAGNRLHRRGQTSGGRTQSPENIRVANQGLPCHVPQRKQHARYP